MAVIKNHRKARVTCVLAERLLINSPHDGNKELMIKLFP